MVSHYIKLPQFNKNKWEVPVRYEYGWYKHIFTSYKEAYNFYIKKLLLIKQRIATDKTR